MKIAKIEKVKKFSQSVVPNKSPVSTVPAKPSSSGALAPEINFEPDKTYVFGVGQEQGISLFKTPLDGKDFTTTLGKYKIKPEIIKQSIEEALQKAGFNQNYNYSPEQNAIFAQKIQEQLFKDFNILNNINPQLFQQNEQ